MLQNVDLIAALFFGGGRWGLGHDATQLPNADVTSLPLSCLIFRRCSLGHSSCGTSEWVCWVLVRSKVRTSHYSTFLEVWLVWILIHQCVGFLATLYFFVDALKNTIIVSPAWERVDRNF